MKITKEQIKKWIESAKTRVNDLDMEQHYNNKNIWKKN